MFKKGHTPWNKGISAPSNGKKSKKSHFAKGYTPWNKGCEVSWDTTKEVSTFERMESKEYELVVKPRMDGTLLTTPDCDGNSGPMCVLRPRKTVTEELKLETKNNLIPGMSTIDNEELMTMINSAIHLHASEISSSCQTPMFAYYDITKWGICFKYQLYCVNCNFRTPVHKLYKTIPNNKRGPDPAAPNVGFALGVQETAIGNTRARQLLSNFNCPPPARSTL